ncbi:alanine racemase [Ruania rhizosphaerae]|uniref:alanine racemase n=1 Tax=Ruania rhizosphaerae TaxID=1840413 RepID=UPI0013574266|nr:alanine racemase [Ruania rhizosphaerae]
MTIGSTGDWAIDWTHKSFPPSGEGVRADSIGDQGWHALTDFSTPLAVLHEDALEHNQRVMSDFCSRHGVALAPHGKTTMSPELIGRQLAGGAWGMTAATAWQARAMITMGATRVMIANECLDPVGLCWLVERMAADAGLEVLVFADSTDAVDQMGQIVAGATRPLPVLVEVGEPDGRAGLRDHDTGIAVAEAIAGTAGLRLAGVAGFEGVVGSSRTDATEAAARAFLTRMRTLAVDLLDQGLLSPGAILTAGGSMYFDLVAEELTGVPGTEVVLRSGCYLIHDHGLYADATPLGGPDGLQPALEVWARVLSTPEAGLAILDAGRRDISSDAGMPPLRARFRDGHTEPIPDGAARIRTFNDQHTIVETSHLRVGDLVQLGISHPCTTLDRWRAIPVIDDQYRVRSSVRTIF